MRPTARLIRTSALALVLGVTSWVIAAGGASGATAPTLRDGSFSTDLVESTPAVQTPSAGATLVFPTNPVSLSWGSIPGATTYQVQIARHSDASVDCAANGAFNDDRIIVTKSTSETAWSPELTSPESGSAIVLNTSYCWRVRAAGTINGNWSAARRFTVSWTGKPSSLRFYNDEDGSIPRLTTDSDYATGDTMGHDTGYLSWAGVAGAAGYDVQVSRSPSFATPLLSVEGHVGTRLTLPQLPDEDGYYWRVRAVSPNGDQGAWVMSSTFAIQRYTSTWVDPSAAYPAYDSLQTEYRIGWDPVPGASYYEYQVATRDTCFWDWTQGQTAPAPYGDPASPGNCLLSDSNPTVASTINNYVSLNGMLSEAVLTNITTNCDLTSPSVEPVPCPDIDIPLLSNGHKIYWRVRPVWEVSQATQSDLKVGSTLKIYGDWLLNEQAGFARPNVFKVERPTLGQLDTIDTNPDRCDNPISPSTDCAHLMDGQLSATNASFNSTSMQLPLLRWGAFPGRWPGQGHVAAGGYEIQVAHDPYFTNMVWNTVQGSPDGLGAGASVFDTQQSYAFPTNAKLGDDTDGNGYWWRVIPCQSGNADTLCEKFYYEGSPGLSYLISGAPGFNDGAQARTFSKQVKTTIKQVDNFSGSAPLLFVGDTGSTTPLQFANGIQGADHYEFQLSRTSNFDGTGTDAPRTLTTTVPRVVPYKPGAAAGQNEAIESGSWHWRVRPVDSAGVQGAWSDSATFEVAPGAPTGLTATADDVDGGALLAWSPVDGASSYEVAWSTDGTYLSGVTTVSTHQTAVQLPASAGGSYAWHVRATNGTWSNWTEGTPVTVSAPTKLRYALDKTSVVAGGKVGISGQLLLAGTAVNGKTVQLQRKTTNCNVTGAYRQVASAVTGNKTLQGMVKYTAAVGQSGCYRLAYAGTHAVNYSAPFPIGATPSVSAKVNDRTVRNGGAFCTTVTSKTAMTGTTQIQYLVGKKWTVARSATITSKKTYRECAAIRTPGNYTVRLALVGLKHPTQGYTTYDNTYLGLGKVRVNNVFKVL